MRANPPAVLHAMRGLQKVMDDNGRLLASVNSSGARKRFDALADALDTTLGPTAGRLQLQKGLTAEKKQLVATVREDYLRPLAAAAEVLGESIAELRPVTLPSARRVGQFVIQSRATLAIYAKHRDSFAAIGIAPDLDVTVEAMLKQIESLSVTRDLERAARVGANKAAGEIVAKVPPVLRLLDSLAKPILRKHDKLLRQWAEVRKLARASSKALPAPPAMKLLPASTGDASASPVQPARRRRRK